MKRLSVIKGVISYILALILAVVFALYINAKVGWFMLIALILALVLSVFFAWLTRKNIEVQLYEIIQNIEHNRKLLSKGDCYEMQVIITNKSIFPTTPIELKVLDEDGVKCENKNIIVSVMPMSKKKVVLKFNAKISGPAHIGVKSVIITDYLGVLSLEHKNIDYSKLATQVGVIPDIADVSPKDDRILKAMQISIYADDSEDTIEAKNYSFGGFPGYENRDYIPGDPLKRVNWKQSAKRGKLLVRLDDEMASSSVNVVLDSVYNKYAVRVDNMSLLNQYSYCPKDEIIQKIAEDAVENTLGIVRTMVLNNYTVNLYVFLNNQFVKYSIEDEKDVENVRIELADYKFETNKNLARLPGNEEFPPDSAFIFSTPNEYKDAYEIVENFCDTGNVSIFSIIEEARSSGTEGTSLYFRKNEKKKKKMSINPTIIPILLALTLSVTVFSAYRVSPISHWTLIQLLVCIFIFGFCSFVRRRKIVGTMLLIIIIMMLLMSTINIAFFTNSYGMQYMQWFSSGGDLLEFAQGDVTQIEYLMTIIMIFTTFFGMVIFFYTQVKYRTSALLLVSLIPSLIYAKIVRDIEIGYVMITIVLNVAAFLVNTRKNRDKGKKIVGYVTGLASLGLYALLFVLIALAVPKSSETKYYYQFEEAFLGGNTTTIIPMQFQANSEFSGNADGFNQLNNRKLYTITGISEDYPLYMKRQVFDYYDYELNRWYKDDFYNEYYYDSSDVGERENLNIAQLADAIVMAEKLEPGFVDKYGLGAMRNHELEDDILEVQVEAHNYSNYSYIVPTRTIAIYDGYNEVLSTLHGVWINGNGSLPRDAIYDVEFYEQYENRIRWVELGGANFSLEESIDMLEDMEDIFLDNEETRFLNVVQAYIKDAKLALEYKNIYERSNAEIPERVKELAEDITKDLEYDWQKAEALQNYFYNGEYIYDLEYEAPDDSVEYFLFEGKTGTCSDFASAYVLMARSVGLTVRYVEGFVPGEEAGLEYDTQYVVRTKSAHAYPEVYIQNYGYVVFEPTIGADESDENFEEVGVSGYVMLMGYRVLLIFATVSLALVIIIFITKLLIPVLSEKLFIFNIRRENPNKAAVKVYKRIIDKFSDKFIENADTYTPEENARRWMEVTGYDMGPLANMVEKSAYASQSLDNSERQKAEEIYEKVKLIAKSKKKN